MPEIRPFRALRYRPEAIGDLARVVSPPYDIISPAQQRTLLDRHPSNVVRLDLPESEPGEEPDERYRRAARTLAAWRSDGTLHKDSRASIYVYEQSYQPPGAGDVRVQRGFFGRLRLEPLEPGSGVRRHERTMVGPREDRYRLLRATGVNTSPVVMLHEDATGGSAAALDAIAARPPDVDLVDDDGAAHRMWVVPEADNSDAVAALIGGVCAAPLTIADGHHRYETALRYRDERRMSRSCEEDPAFDYLLALFLDARSQPLTVLPTHRVALGLDGPASDLVAALGPLFSVTPADRSTVAAVPTGPGGRSRLGLWTGDGNGYLLDGRRADLDPLLPQVGEAARGLDVTILGVALERLGIGADEVAGGERIRYTKSADEAMNWVDAGLDGATAAFILEPTPIASIIDVAAAGDVMPQKSTYFHPKPLTGLVINPHEW